MRISAVFVILAPLLALGPSQELIAPAAPAGGPPAAVALTTPGANTRLQGDLERLIESPGWRGDRWSVLVVSLDKGDTLFNHGGDESLVPASNLKLFTTA